MIFKRYILIVLTIAAVLGLIGCQKKEISILKDLHTKLVETHGDLSKAKTVLGDFLKNNDEKIKNAVADFQESKGEERDYRYLDFNRHYYDKDGLRELVDFNYRYTMDPEFNKLFEDFKKKCGIFFQEDSLRKKF